MPDELPVLKEQFRYMHKEVEEMKDDLKQHDRSLQARVRFEERIQFQLKSIQTELSSLTETIQKDTGWRGFILDFVKAVAQIAALVGAGKFIF
ncbi:hypothetical protein [Halobacillus sp. H74]|uniref:hypothetical protein n=1 Tax=Halobacillus sp. H74 TaxID=3457436 RepID=UPI003FCE125A